MAASKLKQFPPHELALYHLNPKLGDIPTITASLRAHGQYKPVVVNVGTHTGRPNEVLAGNHTLMAIRGLAESEPADPRWRKVDAYLVDVDDDQAKRIVLVDNKSADLGTYDNAQLFALLGSLPELTGTGYTGDDLGDLRALLEESAVITDPELDEGLIKNKDMDDKADAYGEANTRVIVLQYPIVHFMWMQEKLAAYREAFGLDSNPEAIIDLISRWANEVPPADDTPDQE